jgi:hypothetical protein
MLAVALVLGEYGGQFSRDTAALEAPTASLAKQPEKEAAMVDSELYHGGCHAR